MNKKLVIIIGLALLFATGSTYFFYRMISQRVEGAARATTTDYSVVVAARDLKRGEQLGPEDVTLAPWAGPALPKGAFADTNAVAGKLVTFDVSEGELLTDSQVLVDNQRFASARIRPGMRAVSVHLGEFAGVTQIFEPGDRVDVIVATGNPSAGATEVRLKTILQNIEVLTTGRDAAKGGRPVATLLVESKDAEMLSTADHSGYIRLVLRNPLDDSVQKTQGSRLSDVLRGP